jgi:hypothetical protein
LVQIDRLRDQTVKFLKENAADPEKKFVKAHRENRELKSEGYEAVTEDYESVFAQREDYDQLLQVYRKLTKSLKKMAITEGLEGR